MEASVLVVTLGGTPLADGDGVCAGGGGVADVVDETGGRDVGGGFCTQVAVKCMLSVAVMVTPGVYFEPLVVYIQFWNV